jgi:hypothetical protein
MPAEAVTIKGLPELARKLDNLQDLKQIIPELKASASHIKGTVNVYPPHTIANSPDQGRWYERGYGSRWQRKDGTVGGRKTSETLGRKWTTKKRDRGLTWIIGNNVSYGEYVQDRGKQAKFHKRRGWKTIQDVAEQEAETVVNFIKAKVDKILAK